MENKIQLPELKNPINSNFTEESATAGLVCKLTVIIVSAVVYVIA